MKKTVQKSLKKKILSIVADVLIVLIALVVLMMFYTKITGKKIFSVSVLWVITPSMEDTIPASSYILVKTVDPADLKVDDIITFHSRDPALNGALNTHRIKEINGQNESFVTQGDNNLIPDHDPVYPEDVVAIYVRNLPLLTFFGRFYSSPFGLAATLIVVMMIMSGWFSLFRKKQEKAYKDEEIRRRIEEEIERLKNADAEAHNAPSAPDSKDGE